MNKIYIDGGCKSNPGKMRMCVLITENDKETFRSTSSLKDGTNNLAELLALERALSHLENLQTSGAGLHPLTIYTDSQWLYHGMIGDWKISVHKALVTELRKKLNAQKLTIQWIPRSKNLAGHILEKLE